MKPPLPPSGRREFLKTGGAVAAGLLTAVAPLVRSSTSAFPPLPANANTPAAIPTRNLGKTGYKVGIFSLGGQAALEKPNNFDVAVPIIERALDLGVNYIDTSSIYGGPQRWSEQYVGKVMKTTPPRGLPRHQDQGTHPRRLPAHDRKVARSCCKPTIWTFGSCTTSACRTT